MSDVTFVQTRWVYDSYVHMRELIRLAGFKTCFVDEIDWDSKTTYVLYVLNGEVPNPLPAHRCQLVWWNLERPGSYPTTYRCGRPDIDRLIVCDRNWADRVGAEFAVLGSDARLGYYDPDKRWDVATNCYETGRRQAVFAPLKAAGFSFAPNSFNLPDAELAASRLQLLPQQDDGDHAVTPLRFAIGSAYHLPLVYELDADPFPFVSGRDFFHTPYAELVERTTTLLLHPDGGLQRIGDNLHQKLCRETDFATEVRRML